MEPSYLPVLTEKSSMFYYVIQARFYALNHPKQVEFDKGVMEFIVKVCANRLSSSV